MTTPLTPEHPRTYSLVGSPHLFLVTDDESGITLGYADSIGGPLVAPPLARERRERVDPDLGSGWTHVPYRTSSGQPSEFDGECATCPEPFPCAAERLRLAGERVDPDLRAAVTTLISYALAPPTNEASAEHRDSAIAKAKAILAATEAATRDASPEPREVPVCEAEIERIAAALPYMTNDNRFPAGTVLGGHSFEDWRAWYRVAAERLYEQGLRSQQSLDALAAAVEAEKSVDEGQERG